ncbi:MAG: hypothetical protein DRI90_18045 [Deltaproteobacteria bacterium]|nr:MAG: hypothetical protein DRI90_18045 [Deltaproteobacteria bacterium]
MAAGRRSVAAMKTLGPYNLIAELHQSYLGAAWIGQAAGDSDAGSLVIARRIDADMATDQDAVAAVLEAAKWATKLDHDNIVKVIGTEQDDDEAIVVSAYHEGEPLRSLLRLAGITRTPMPAPIALRIASDVLEALVQIHDQRFADKPALAAINPDNILICTDGHARLLEPGVSAAAASTGAWAEDPKRAAYDAPEKLSEVETQDQRGDIFSLGVLLWEMLRNRPLFAGASFEAVSKRVQTASIRRVDSLKPAGGEAIEASVANIVAQALDRMTEERFEAATEMQAAIIGEQLASAEEVAEFLEKLASDVLAKQRRKVKGAGSDADPAAEDKPGDKKAPPAKPKRPRKKPPKQTLLGMAIPVTKPTSPAAPDSMAAISLEPVDGDGAAPGPTPLAGTPEAAVGAGAEAKLGAPGGEGDAAPETIDPETIDPESIDPESIDPESFKAEDKLAADAEPDSAEKAVGLAASIEETLAAAADSADKADTKDKPRKLDYDVLSIADDPSIDDSPPLPAETESGPKKSMLLVVGGIMVVALIIIAVVVLGGDKTEGTAGDGAQSSAPVTTSAPTATASEAAPADSATGEATEDAGAESEDAGEEEPPDAGAEKPVVTPTPRPRPRPRPQPTTPKPQPKYTPGGI